MDTATATSHPARLAAARNAQAATRKALATAIAQTAPIDPELDAMMRVRCTPEAYADMIAKIDAIAATIPALRAAAAAATDEVAAIDVASCHRCQGTGEYGAPTSHLRRGRPVCFRCHGTGLA